MFLYSVRQRALFISPLFRLALQQIRIDQRRINLRVRAIELDAGDDHVAPRAELPVSVYLRHDTNTESKNNRSYVKPPPIEVGGASGQILREKPIAEDQHQQRVDAVARYNRDPQSSAD